MCVQGQDQRTLPLIKMRQTNGVQHEVSQGQGPRGRSGNAPKQKQKKKRATDQRVYVICSFFSRTCYISSLTSLLSSRCYILHCRAIIAAGCLAISHYGLGGGGGYHCVMLYSGKNSYSMGGRAGVLFIWCWQYDGCLLSSIFIVSFLPFPFFASYVRLPQICKKKKKRGSFPSGGEGMHISFVCPSVRLLFNNARQATLIIVFYLRIRKGRHRIVFE